MTQVSIERISAQYGIDEIIQMRSPISLSDLYFIRMKGENSLRQLRFSVADWVDCSPNGLSLMMMLRERIKEALLPPALPQ